MSTARITVIVIVTALLVVAAIGVGAYLYVRQHTFTARQRPPEFEIYMADFVRDASTPGSAKKLADPLPKTQDNIGQGRARYVHDCAVCHGNDGRGKTELGLGMYPPVPELRSQDSQDLTDGEIYYTIKNGIPFSGMPAFNFSEDNYWQLVQFMRHLPQITPDEVQEMTAINGIKPRD